MFKASLIDPSNHTYGYFIELVTKKLIFFFVFFLQVTSRLQLGGIIKGQNGVAECGGKIASALAALNNHLGYLLQCLDGMFTFANMHKTD